MSKRTKLITAGHGSHPGACNRRSFLKLLATASAAAPFMTRDLIARPPSGVLRHASFGASGMAWSDIQEIAKFKEVELVAVAEVDLSRTEELKKKFPNTRIYQDWRELLDVEGKGLDSVNVSTPDHMHAIMGLSVMQLGKHLYGQKPMAHDLHEVRQLTEMAKRKRVVTQMGIQIHATSYYHMAKLIVQGNVIGKIKEVHSWCGRSWGDPDPRPNTSDPVPKGLDWNLWLGGCEERPYIGNHAGNPYYHPFYWRKRLDFGTGSQGDMACHIFDPVFSSIGLGSAISVRSEGAAPNQWNWALDGIVHYKFAGTPFTADSTLPVTWYDGKQRPPAEVKALLEGDNFPDNGSVFVGTQGTLLLPHVNKPILYPDKKYSTTKLPEIKSGDHWGEFVQACRGHGETGANFAYSGPLTEAVLLGTVAVRFPQTTLTWNSTTMEFDERAANAFVRRQYRAGWGIKGLV